ncbi:13618_t:CDS:1, partial [Funneliformis geosporum]
HNWVVITQILCKRGQATIHELHAIYIFELAYFHRLISLKYFSNN